MTITVDDKSKTYGEADPEFTGTIEGLVNDDDLGEIVYSRTNSAEDAGTYEKVLTAAYTENANYTVTVVPGNFTIDPKSIDDGDGMTTSELADVVDNGSEQKQPVTVKDGETTLVEGTDYTVAYSEDCTNVGTVTITVTGIGNYAGSVTASYEITPKAAVITVNNAEKFADEADPAFTGTVTGLVNAADLGAITYFRTNANVNAVGTYNAVLSARYTANGNYSVTVVPASFVIKPVYTITFAWTNNPVPNVLPAVPAAVRVHSGEAYTVDNGVNAGDTVFNTFAPDGALIDFYSFAGWNVTRVDAVNGDMTITGTWNLIQQPYTVTYTDGVDGEVIFANQVYGAGPNWNVHYGDPTPAFNGTPEREGYDFAGWTPAVAATVTGNATYTAQWTPAEEPVPEPTPEPTPEPDPSPEPTVIPDPVVPLPQFKSWSLVDVICAVLSALAAIGMGATFFRKKIGETEIKPMPTKFLGTIPAVASAVALFLTQSFDGTMVAVDRWTVLFAGLLAVSGLTAFLTRNRKPGEKV